VEHPVRVAFCPILFGKNGGQFSPNGLPIFRSEDEVAARGRCDIAYDCGVCPHLGEWVGHMTQQGWKIGWECVYCIKDSKKDDEAQGRQRTLPGFYQAGRLPVPPDHPDYDPDQPPLHGCTTCGYESSFLQLVLRK
jgi:hypothetical protein